jgi:NAD(P)-dependent dehydrogenase (short-subunit alcohol dehydrogenase family)
MRVLITGANRGIGRALYDGYVARGDDVIATTRNQASDGWL